MSLIINMQTAMWIGVAVRGRRTLAAGILWEQGLDLHLFLGSIWERLHCAG